MCALKALQQDVDEGCELARALKYALDAVLGHADVLEEATAGPSKNPSLSFPRPILPSFGRGVCGAHLQARCQRDLSRVLTSPSARV